MLLDALTVASKELPRALHMLEDGITRTTDTTAPPATARLYGPGVDRRSLFDVAQPDMADLHGQLQDVLNHGVSRKEQHASYVCTKSGLGRD